MGDYILQGTMNMSAYTCPTPSADLVNLCKYSRSQATGIRFIRPSIYLIWMRGFVPQYCPIFAVGKIPHDMVNFVDI